MTQFNQSLNGNQTFVGQLSQVRWYYGIFKQLSVGLLRGVSRTFSLITRNRNLI